jgi:hypothetical protein
MNPIKRARNALKARRPKAYGRGPALLVLLLVSGVPAIAATLADFESACLSSTNFEESLCECLAEKAQKRLSPKSFDFLVASMQEDEAAAARLRGELSFSELLASGTFMANTPAECAGGHGGHAH